MIGFLAGKIISKNPDNASCVLLCGPVGYEVIVTRPVFESVVLEQSLTLWTYTHVREDILGLFGFIQEEERRFFRMLLGLNGLGPKHAMSLLSEHGASGLGALVMRQDVDGISRAPGIGKKLAQKVILDLQSKIEKLGWAQLAAVTPKSVISKTASPEEQRVEDLASALQNLGFAPQAVKFTLDKLDTTEEFKTLPFEAALRMALRELSGRMSTTDSRPGVANA